MTTYIVVDVNRARIVIESMNAVGLIFLHLLRSEISVLKLSNKTESPMTRGTQWTHRVSANADVMDKMVRIPSESTSLA